MNIFTGENRNIRFLLALTISFTLSCGNAQNIEKIKQSVFGGFVLGSSLNEHLRITDSLKISNALYTTTNTNHDFFVINDKSVASLSRVLLFPVAQYNADSIITRMVFYVYVLEFTSVQAIENSDLPEKEKESVRELSRETSHKHDVLTKNFSLTTNLDKQFSIYAPNTAQGSGFENNRTRDKISSFLEKYPKAVSDETKGNEYDENDFGFSIVSIWKTENIDIKLITKRFPLTDKSKDFYHVLIYEYDDDINKKYNLYKKQKDIRSTF